MFWDIFVKLCNSVGKLPTIVVKEIGIAHGSITEWKRGRIPRDSTLIKIANYFGVTVDYLLGKETGTSTSLSPSSHSITIRGRDGSIIEEDLSDEQIDLIKQLIHQMKN